MKKWFLVLLLLPAMVSAYDFNTAIIEYTVLEADLGADRRDTVYTNEFNAGQYPEITYYWRTWIIEYDSAFANSEDTVIVVHQHSPTGYGPWTNVDVTTVELNGSGDSVMNIAKRINMDSSTYLGNWWRGIVIYGYDLGEAAADTAIVGNTYDVRVNMIFEGKD